MYHTHVCPWPYIHMNVCVCVRACKQKSIRRRNWKHCKNTHPKRTHCGSVIDSRVWVFNFYISENINGRYGARLAEKRGRHKPNRRRRQTNGRRDGHRKSCWIRDGTYSYFDVHIYMLCDCLVIVILFKPFSLETRSSVCWMDVRVCLRCWDVYAVKGAWIRSKYTYKTLKTHFYANIFDL